MLTTGLLIYCFYDLDIYALWSAIIAIDTRFLIPLLFLEGLIALIRASRLKFLVDTARKVGVLAIYPVYCIGIMVNLLMPYLTGQVARVYLFSRKIGLKKTFIFTTTVLEVLFDGMALLGIIFVTSLFVVLPAEFRAWHFIVLAAIILGAMAILFVLSRSKGLTHDIVEKFSGHLPRHSRKRIDDIKFSFFSGLGTLKSSRHLTAVSVLSVSSWLAQAAIVYFLILAFGFSINIWGAVIITAVVSVMMTVVIAPGNIGTFQGATVAAMHPFGVGKSEALAFSFLLHIFIYLPPIILGAIFSFKEGLTYRQLRVEGEKGVDSIDVTNDVVETADVTESK